MARDIETIFETVGDDGRAGILGVDDDSRLYWNGVPLVLEQKLTLNVWVNASVVLAGIAAAVSAIVQVLDYIN